MPPRLSVLILVFFCNVVTVSCVAPTNKLPPKLFKSIFRPEELIDEWKKNVTKVEELDHDLEFSDEDKKKYKEKVRSMFYHAYDGYLKHGYPMDELKPLTCEGHDTWGSFSLTLVDALDTLLVLGNITEFKRASRLVLQSVRTEEDINVSVFETNIRIVGGLLSAHMLQGMANDTSEGWPCSGPLLSLAHQMGERLLPAFNTPTGMPYGTVNLKYGVHKDETPITCTAGVSTFILEFAALSRLTGDERFEKVATRALDSLYKSKSPINLVGNHISVQTGQWTATDSGIGAGIDSYFEYLVKGALLLRKPRLMKQYYDLEDAILSYSRRGDWFHWVSMSSGLTSHAGDMFQSLEAFWPGMLTLLGDVGDAYRVMINYADLIESYGFPPEFWQISTQQPKEGRDAYPLRPEMVESLMYIYRATGDRRLLKLGAIMVDSIEKYAKTSCGYATVKVKSGVQENRMESFFLAETIKYLYLLFDDDNFLHNSHTGRAIETPTGSCVIEAGGYIFNTEAHPLDPGMINCCSINKAQDEANIDDLQSDQSLSDLLDDLLENVSGTGWEGGTAKITVNSISSDAEDLNLEDTNEYIKRQYGSEDIEFEVDETLKGGDSEVKYEEVEGMSGQEKIEGDAEQKEKIMDIIEKWNEKKDEEIKSMDYSKEKKSKQFIKVSGREERKWQRQIESASVHIELGRFEWKREEEEERLKDEGLKQIHELKRQAKALEEQRIKKGLNGTKVSFDVLQALYSITDEKMEEVPLGRISQSELTMMLQQRVAVERVITPYVKCTLCCVPLAWKGDSAAYRAFLSSIYTVLYRTRGTPYLLGPACWKDEEPKKEDHFMNDLPDVTRYRIHDFTRISVEYSDKAMKETVEKEWDLLAVREQSFVERLMGDGEVLPRRSTRAPMTHERREEIGRERLNEDDEYDDIMYERSEDTSEKREYHNEDSDEEWFNIGVNENIEEIMKDVFANRVN